MKVKLGESKRLVVEEDDTGDFFNITTPHGHTLCLPVSHGIPNHNVSVQCFSSWTENNLNRRDEISIHKCSALAPYIMIALDDDNDIDHFYDIVDHCWIKDCINSKGERNLDLISISIRTIEQRFINHILEYDRQCEDNHHLRVMATFCEHLLSRRELLDFMSNVCTNKQ